MPLRIQGHEFKVDFIILPLSDYDAVLDIHWLKQFGPILCDFHQLIVTLDLDGKVHLQGMHST